MKPIMKKIALALSIAAIAFPLALTAAEKAEEQVLKELDSPNAKVVVPALQQLEKKYPTSAAGLAKAKQLLADQRPEVRRKAARVLGVLHTELNDAELKNVVALLKGEDQEQMDGLKALRDLRAKSTVADVVPLLKDPTPNVIRDACRTLAVIGTKDHVADIEPLANHPNPAVKKDAQDAIFALKNK
jgi:HEAT repeat protein